MKPRLSSAVAALVLWVAASMASAQDRTFAARSFLMDDNAGHTYRLAVPSLSGDRTFLFPSGPITPGALLYGSADNQLSILPGGSPGDILVYSGSSMPAWSSTLSSLHLNSLDLGTNGPGGVPGLLNIRDGANPGHTGTIGFTYPNFTLGGSGLVTGNGAIDAGSGGITGGSLNVGTGAIGGGSLNVGTGAISGGAISGTSLNVGTGAITGGAITGTSLNLGTGAITAGAITGAAITGTSLSAGSGSITGGSLNVGSGGITGGAISGSSMTITSLGAGVVHSSSGGALSSGPVTNSDLSNSSITLSNGTGVTVTGGSPVSLGGTATIAIGQDVATGASPVFAGMKLNGALNMSSNLINNVTDPVSAQDAATKNYVDLNSAGVLIHPSTSLRNTIDPTADVVLLTLKGFPGQTQNMFNVTNNTGTILASIDATGAITGASLSTGSGTIQTTGAISGGSVTGAQVAVTTSLSGAGVGKFAGLVPAATVSSVDITVPELLATSSITVTLETTTGGIAIPFVSLRTPGTPGQFRVSFTGVTPADGQINYIVIK